MVWYIQHELGELCRWVVPFYPFSCILKSYLYSHEWNHVEGNKVLQEKHARLIIFITTISDVSSMMGIHKAIPTYQGGDQGQDDATLQGMCGNQVLPFS